MLTEALAALAAAGGTAVVGAMATDAWQAARSGITRVLSRSGSPRQEVIEAQLDEDAGVLERTREADRDQIRQELLPVWRRRLGDYLQQHPDAAEELGELVDQVREQLPSSQQAWVNDVTVQAGRDAFIAGRDQTFDQRNYAQEPR
ncbi:MAG: hypothetical protein M3332_17315 [Actinomycetota bacterium]|nr:hypothetical protein [Actinomycetota bacterium]